MASNSSYPNRKSLLLHTYAVQYVCEDEDGYINKIIERKAALDYMVLQKKSDTFQRVMKTGIIIHFHLQQKRILCLCRIIISKAGLEILIFENILFQKLI